MATSPRFRPETTPSAAIAVAFERAPCGVAVLDGAGRFEHVNPAFTAMLGRAAAELLRMTWAEVVGAQNRFASKAGRHDDLDGEFRALRPDGTEVWMAVTASPLPEYDRVVAHCHDVTEERAREMRFKAVLDAAAEAIIGIDEHDVVRIFSPAAERLFGWRAAEIVGQPVWRLALPGRESEAGTMRETLAAGLPLQRETVLVRRDGTEVDAFMTVGPTIGPDGSYRGATVTCLDISDRRRAEREAGRSRGLLQQLIDHAPNVIAFKDRHLRYLLVNRLGADVLGARADRIPGHTDADLLEAAEAERNHEEDREVMRRGAPMTFSKDVTLPGGAVRPHLTTKFPLRGADGEVEGVGIVAVDMSEIRRGDADRARLGALAEAVPDAIVIQDAEGTITSWNRGAQAMFGLTPGEAIGRSYQDALVPEADRPAFRRVWRDLGYGRARSLRTGALRADGSTFPAQISAAALTDGGSLTGAVSVIRDITDMVEAQQELERSNNDLERFAYAASHDLQEPLRSIGLVAESLQLAAADRLEDDEQHLLEHVERSAARMTAQVQALMQLARVALDHAPDAATPIADALRDAREALRDALREAGAEVSAPEPLPSVTVPRAELALVLQNLIGNALKFRRPDVPLRIEIAAREAGADVEITVADNGIGLTPEAASRIFGLFERDRSGVPGTGVGLAVCRHILERRGGSISVPSSGPGEGAAFALRMPAAGPA